MISLEIKIAKLESIIQCMENTLINDEDPLSNIQLLYNQFIKMTGLKEYIPNNTLQQKIFSKHTSSQKDTKINQPVPKPRVEKQIPPNDETTPTINLTCHTTGETRTITTDIPKPTTTRNKSNTRKRKAQKPHPTSIKKQPTLHSFLESRPIQSQTKT